MLCDNRLRLFHDVRKATLIRRVNRFLLKCDLDGVPVDVFLPNPGRLHELLFPGATIHIVAEQPKAPRKTDLTAVAVDRHDGPVMLHTSHTNSAARYLLGQQRIPGLERASVVKPEVRAEGCRFDFLLEDVKGPIYLEVKSCTLAGARVAMFPDAVTERGTKHLLALEKLAAKGMRTAILFLVHVPGVSVFMPDYHTDLHFSRTLLRVRDTVDVKAVSVTWEDDLSLSPSVTPLEIPWSYIETEAHDRGSYLLILEATENFPLTFGPHRECFSKGFYVYVGSAMKNLTQRIERHRRLRKKMHWHIDALRAVTRFRAALPVRASARLECDLARAVRPAADRSVPGFGASDCSCDTHLFAFADDPLLSVKFRSVLQRFRMDRYPLPV